MSLVYIKDYLEELDKGISNKEWFLKDENKRLRDHLERSIKSFESKNQEIKELNEEKWKKRSEIEVLNQTIACLYKYINLKEEYQNEYDSYYGTCCSYCDGGCSDHIEESNEIEIDLKLKEQSLKYLEDIIFKEKKKERKCTQIAK
jgi:hypothetical protein